MFFFLFFRKNIAKNNNGKWKYNQRGQKKQPIKYRKSKSLNIEQNIKLTK